MTESEWLICKDPRKMLEFLGSWASTRKLRLFACACCRLVWFEFTSSLSRRAVEVAERFADGQADRREVLEAKTKAWKIAMDHERARQASGRRPELTEHLAFLPTYPYEETAANIAGRLARNIRAIDDVRDAALDLLRDIFGNPFRQVAVDPEWLTRNGGAVANLAQSIYEVGRFEELGVLADALEDAGCQEETLLDHCRGDGPHVRGCWVLDLILGKS
jgi:hypothetical protein